MMPMVLGHPDDAHEVPFGCVWCCFHLSLSYHIMMVPVVFHQTDYTITDRAATIDPSFKALLAYPHFPSLPTSFGKELLPIKVSFGCDTI